MKRLLQLGLLLLLQVAAMAQTRQLTGTVKDAKTGLGLGSATVQVQGKSARAITNENGEFTLIVPTGAATLQISYVGYGTKSISLAADQASIDISLDQEAAQNAEVVVTALGISKQERKVGYAITTVKGDQLNQAREVNVANSLTGQVAGLSVHATSGGPGSTARILLRGVPSITGSGSPLFVVNGVPIDNGNRGASGEWGGADAGDGIGNINPDDIETMTVLKGQSASALYGARASNGVILITTKTGKKGTAQVEYNTNYQIDRAVDNTDYQYQFGQGTNGAKPGSATEARGDGRFSWGAPIDNSSVIGYNGAQYKYSAVKAATNLHDFYRNGPSWTNTVALSGGGETGTYRIAATTLDNSSIVRNSGVHRKSFNFNTNQNLTNKLSFSMIANYIDQQDILRPSTSDGPGNPNNFYLLANTVDVNRYKPGYDSTGREIVFSDDNYVTNPWFVVNQWKYNTGRKRLIASITPKYNFTDWIYALVRFGYDSENDRYDNITPTGTDYSVNGAGQSGSIALRNSQTDLLNIDGLLNINHSIVKDLLSFDATLGGTFRKDHFETQQIGGGPFVIPYLYTPFNVVSFNRDYNYTAKEVHSGFYSVDFSVFHFLTLSTTGRLDAYSSVYNSAIPKNKRNIFVPSISGSFLFSDLLHSTVLNYGKLRASYAQTSNEPGTPYQTSVTYSVGNALNGVPTGNYNDGLSNLFLKPFTKTEYEAGLETKFLDNRVGFDLAVYTQQTHNEILGGNLGWETGYNSHQIATAQIRNTGIELQISGTPIKTQHFTWNSTFNFTFQQNKVLQTDESGGDVSEGTYRPLNAATAFRKGLAGPQIFANDYTYDSTKGNSIVVDGNGLPIAGKRIPLGSVLPKYYGGFRNDFMLGNFNLSFLIDFNYGNKILSATADYTTYYGLNKKTLVGRTGTGVHVVGVMADHSNYDQDTVHAQDYWQRMSSISRGNVLNGDYVKLRQVTFGYTFNDRMLAKVPVFSAITVSLVARNLWTIMKQSPNIDPESAFRGDIQYAGIEGGSLPSTRTYGVNVNIKFKK